MFFSKKKYNRNKGLFCSKTILRKYNTEDKMNVLSKKQLENMICTLDKEIQHRNNSQSIFFTWMGLYLTVLILVLTNSSIDEGSRIFKQIGGKMYQLESIEMKASDEIIKEWPGESNMTYTFYKGLDTQSLLLSVSSIIITLLALYYMSNIIKLNKIYKLYNIARYLHSIK